VSSKSNDGKNSVVSVDNIECLGCGACADVCPEVFEMDCRTGKAWVITFDMSDKECIEEAIAICPAECISTEDQG
jgi:ferredoxin